MTDESRDVKQSDPPNVAIMADESPAVIHPDPPLNAVIIVRSEADDGTISTDVVTNGNVLPTEVQTIIELGLQSWRRKIGLVH